MVIFWWWTAAGSTAEIALRRAGTAAPRESQTFGFSNLSRSEGEMNRNPRSFGAIVKHPSAFLPMAMSLTALAVVIGHIAIFGIAREADEGAAAHIWQLLMAGQLPVLAFFAIKWLPRAPRQALSVLALQLVAALSSMAPVYFLNL
jgi:hypothetical protein